MRGFQAYQIHTAMNLHFSEKGGYDCHKYNFKTKANEDSFMKSPFRWQYMGLEKQYMNVYYLIFQAFQENNFEWLTPKALFKFARFDVRAKTNTSLDPEMFLIHQFVPEIIYLKEKCPDWKSMDDLYPVIFKEYQAGNVDIKTLVILDTHIKNCINKDRSRDIIVWPRFVEKVEKIRPFVIDFFPDVDTIRNLYRNHYC